MAQPATKLLQRHWQILTVVSERDQDKTTRTVSCMLNDCVSARRSPMYQYVALTSLRDSHPLPSRGFTKFTQLHVVTSQFVMVIPCALRARIEDRTGSRHNLVEVIT